MYADKREQLLTEGTRKLATSTTQTICKYIMHKSVRILSEWVAAGGGGRFHKRPRSRKLAQVGFTQHVLTTVRNPRVCRDSLYNIISFG